MFDSVIRSVVAEEYHTVFIIVQADLGHLFALTNVGGSTSPDVVTSLEIYVYYRCIYSRPRVGLDCQKRGPSGLCLKLHATRSVGNTSLLKIHLLHSSAAILNILIRSSN